uniref:NADH-ubiquinone oxidoreductase chain 1 n=1 Tax=Trichuris muris TaxID=70415 RepID=A0A0S3M495_TRIMR|nr:NADH dehydrogenase subunit 1 [Trichuris muris]BAT21239.1 NADH dehydrogenase subunit 1 [Trichuris muris]
MLIWLLQVFILTLMILFAVAFITLLERAYMGISQRRRGPNKISFWGILQPVLDGVKLMMKSTMKPNHLNMVLFSFIPAINFMLFITFWSAMPFLFKIMQFSLSSLFVIVLLGMMGFGIMITGWASNNKYALFGSLRSMTQSISYEVTLSLVILSVMCMKNSLDLSTMWKGFINMEIYFSIIFLLPAVIMILAECGRTPFDLMEAESELVSGYNVEYGSMEFAFLFMTEYGMIILLSILFSIMLSPMISSYVGFIIMSSILFARYTLPRMRYDYLMSLMWKSLLPAVILIWMVIFNLSVSA